MFKELSTMLADGQTLALTIMKCGNRLSVAVLPQNEQVTDAAKAFIVPLTITGTPEELDAGFIASITWPLESANGLLSNMAEFDKALQKTKEEAKATKDKAAQVSKVIKEAEELEKEDKVAEALVVYKKALELDGSNQKVKARINELTHSLAQIDLFAEDVKAATQTIQKVEEVVNKPQQPATEPKPTGIKLPESTQMAQTKVSSITEPEPQPQRDMFAELMGIAESKTTAMPEPAPLPTVPPEPIQSPEPVQTPEIDMEQYRKFMEFQKFQQSLVS